MALPDEVADLTFSLDFFGSGSLVHFWSPFGSLCRFNALFGTYLASLEPKNFVRIRVIFLKSAVLGED